MFIQDNPLYHVFVHRVSRATVCTAAFQQCECQPLHQPAERNRHYNHVERLTDGIARYSHIIRCPTLRCSVATFMLPSAPPSPPSACTYTCAAAPVFDVTAATTHVRRSYCLSLQPSRVFTANRSGLVGPTSGVRGY